MLESSANLEELQYTLVLKELLSFEVPEVFFQFIESRSLIWRGRIEVAVEDCGALSLNCTRCVADVYYLLCAEAVAFFLSLTLIFLLYQSWLGFSDGMVFKGKQGQNEAF